MRLKFIPDFPEAMEFGLLFLPEHQHYIYNQPVQGIEEKTVKLGEEALENVKMGTNEITGDIIGADCHSRFL